MKNHWLQARNTRTKVNCHVRFGDGDNVFEVEPHENSLSGITLKSQCTEFVKLVDLFSKNSSLCRDVAKIYVHVGGRFEETFISKFSKSKAMATKFYFDYYGWVDGRWIDYTDKEIIILHNLVVQTAWKDNSRTGYLNVTFSNQIKSKYIKVN